jgi:hypothetical protein
MVIAYENSGSTVGRVETNLQNTESSEPLTLEYIVHFSSETGKPSNFAKYLPCEFYMDVSRPETTQHGDTHDFSSVLSTPHLTVNFSEAP